MKFCLTALLLGCFVFSPQFNELLQADIHYVNYEGDEVAETDDEDFDYVMENHVSCDVCPCNSYPCYEDEDIEEDWYEDEVDEGWPGKLEDAWFDHLQR